MVMTSHAVQRNRRCVQRVLAVFAFLFFGAVLAEGVERSFNKDSFKRILTEEAFRKLDGTPESLEIERDFPASAEAPSSFTKVVEVSSCRDVLNSDQEWIAAGQSFQSFRALKADCKALDAYANSIVAERSHLPDALSEQSIKNFPALVVPSVSSEDQARREGKTLSELHSGLQLTEDRHGGVTMDTSASRVSFNLIARSDVDHDGYQDWLVKVFHAFKGGQGNITALMKVTRRGSSEPFEVERLY